jgi:hypothetical protein
MMTEYFDIIRLIGGLCDVFITRAPNREKEAQNLNLN